MAETPQPSRRGALGVNEVMAVNKGVTDSSPSPWTGSNPTTPPERPTPPPPPPPAPKD